jgi:hypothetical protein
MGFLDETCIYAASRASYQMFSQRDVDRAYTRAPFLAKPLLSIFLPHHGRTMEQSNVFFLYDMHRSGDHLFFFKSVHAPFGLTGRQVGTCQFESIGTQDATITKTAATLSYVNLWEF